jgi:TonB family protein
MFKVVAPRVISNFALSAAFLAALFVGVVILHLSLNAMLRNAGLEPNASTLLAGALSVMLVLLAWVAGQDVLARRRRRHDAERVALELPDGPCCVIYRSSEGAEMPWTITGAVQVAYPRAARRLGVEGLAVVDFEVGGNGRAKNLHCVDVWPHRLFYEAAAQALLQARFKARDGKLPRFGPTYRMPFVFRMRGASAVTDHGRRARRARGR